MENMQMLTFDDLTLIYPEHLWIQPSSLAWEEAWHQAVMNRYTNAAAQYRAFLNYLCLSNAIAWLQDEPDLQQRINIDINSLSPDLYQRWEFVNGFELKFGQIRLVFIPNEQDSISEFSIPQEWVDIPNWAANYYLPIQVNVQERWLRIGGFISYEQVRQTAKFDASDRNYYVNSRNAIADINIMWMTLDACSLQPPQVQPLPTFSQVRANRIIERLSESSVYSPRLLCAFAEWGTILSSIEYREVLFNKRSQNLLNKPVETTAKVIQDLSLWFEGIFEGGWQTIDDLLALTDTQTFKFRSDSVLNEVYVKGVKLIDLGMQLENRTMALLIGLLPQIDNKVAIRIQLYPAAGETYLPANLQLTLLSESGQMLQSVISRSYDNYIQLKRFKVPLGKFFSIQVALNDVKIKERFILDGFGNSEI
jgi:Protein of unknown function (DUF1822)